MEWTKQRGSKFKYSVVIFFYKLLGYRFAKIIVWFTAFYYSIFARDAIESITDFHKVLGIRSSLREIHKQFYKFALTILDGVLVNMKLEEFNYDKSSNFQEYIDEISLGGGKIIASAHIGCWQMSSYELSINNTPINIITYKQGSAELDKMAKGNHGDHIKIINFSNDFFNNITQIRKALSENEIIAMFPDRFIDIKNTVKVKFLGKDTLISSIPFMISYVMEVPICNIFTTRVKDRHYMIDVESIIYPDRNMKRNDYIQFAAERYIQGLEQVVKENYYQWFNFYKFWDMEKFYENSFDNRWK